MSETDAFLQEAVRSVGAQAGGDEERNARIILTCATFSLPDVQWCNDTTATSATELLNAAAAHSGVPVQQFVVSALAQVLKMIKPSILAIVPDLKPSKSLAVSLFVTDKSTGIQSDEDKPVSPSTKTAHSLTERVDQMCFAWLITTFVQGLDLSSPKLVFGEGEDALTVAQVAPSFACRLVRQNTQDTASRRLGALLLRHCARTLSPVELRWHFSELRDMLLFGFNLRDDAGILRVLLEAALAVARSTNNSDFQDALVAEWLKHTPFVASSASSTGVDTASVERVYFGAGLGFVKLQRHRAALHLNELVRVATSQYATFAMSAKKTHILLASQMLDMINYLMETLPMLMRGQRVRILKALCTTLTSYFANAKSEAHVPLEDITHCAKCLAHCCTKEQREELLGVLQGLPELEPLSKAIVSEDA